jgi:hypothetical protein
LFSWPEVYAKGLKKTTAIARAFVKAEVLCLLFGAHDERLYLRELVRQPGLARWHDGKASCPRASNRVSLGK